MISKEADNDTFVVSSKIYDEVPLKGIKIKFSCNFTNKISFKKNWGKTSFFLVEVGKYSFL